MSSNSVDIEDNGLATEEAVWPRQVIEAVRGIRYGSVEVIVHDGHVVQIERRVKVRLNTADRRPPEGRGRETNHERRAHPTHGGAEPLETREEKQR